MFQTLHLSKQTRSNTTVLMAKKMLQSILKKKKRKPQIFLQVTDQIFLFTIGKKPSQIFIHLLYE